MRSDSNAASISGWSCQSAAYQRSENPAQAVTSREVVEAERQQEADRRVEEGVADDQPGQQGTGTGHAHELYDRPSRMGTARARHPRGPASTSPRCGGARSGLANAPPRCIVMGGLVPAITSGGLPLLMAGTSPAMTLK